MGGGNTPRKYELKIFQNKKEGFVDDKSPKMILKLYLCVFIDRSQSLFFMVSQGFWGTRKHWQNIEGNKSMSLFFGNRVTKLYKIDDENILIQETKSVISEVLFMVIYAPLSLVLSTLHKRSQELKQS